MKESPLRDKSFQFALRIVKLYQYLCKNKKEYTLSKQLLKAGTSIGANVREAQNGESGNDFIHKLGISQKECDEAMFWLELLYRSKYLSQVEFLSMEKDAQELIKMLRSAIITSKKKVGRL